MLHLNELVVNNVTFRQFYGLGFPLEHVEFVPSCSLSAVSSFLYCVLDRYTLAREQLPLL